MEKVRDRLLNVEQVKLKLQCSRSHVYNLISMGHIKALKLGDRKGVRVYESVVSSFLEKRGLEEGL